MILSYIYVPIIYDFIHILYVINTLFSLPQQVIYFSGKSGTSVKGNCNVAPESLLSNLTQGYSKAQNWVLYYANYVLLQEMNMQHAVSKIKTEFLTACLGKHIKKRSFLEMTHFRYNSILPIWHLFCYFCLFFPK